jgi:hypothetical protein
MHHLQNLLFIDLIIKIWSIYIYLTFSFTYTITLATMHPTCSPLILCLNQHINLSHHQIGSLSFSIQDWVRSIPSFLCLSLVTFNRLWALAQTRTFTCFYFHLSSIWAFQFFPNWNKAGLCHRLICGFYLFLYLCHHHWHPLTACHIPFSSHLFPLPYYHHHWYTLRYHSRCPTFGSLLHFLILH